MEALFSRGETPSAAVEAATARKGEQKEAELEEAELDLESLEAEGADVQLHKYATTQLQRAANKIGVVGGNRTELMDNIRLVLHWRRLPPDEQRTMAKVLGVNPQSQGDPIEQLVAHFWPKEPAKPAAQPAPQQAAPAQTSPPSSPPAAPTPRSPPSVPDAPLNAPLRLERTCSSTSPPVPETHSDDELVAEVRRILQLQPKDHMGVLNLSEQSLSAANSRYRQLMRLLHPDKRTADAVHRAGGKERCDQAMARVQEAVKGVEAMLSRSTNLRNAEHLLQRPGPGRGSTVRRPPPRVPERDTTGGPLPPGSPPPRDLGRSPCWPLPRPSPPFGLCRVLIVD